MIIKTYSIAFILMVSFVLLNCTHEVIRKDLLVESQKEVSSNLVVKTDTLTYRESGFPIEAYVSSRFNQCGQVITTYRSTPQPWVRYTVWGSALGLAGTSIGIGAHMISTGKFGLGWDIGIVGLISGLGIVRGEFYLNDLISKLDRKKKTPVDTFSISSVPVTNKTLNLKTPSGLTWDGITSPEGKLLIPWSFLGQAANTTTGSELTLEFSLPGLTPAEIKLSRYAVNSIVTRRTEANELLADALEDMEAGDIKSAHQNLKEVEELVPNSNIAQKVSEIIKSDLPRAALSNAETRIVDGLQTYLNEYEIETLLYLAENVSSETALLVMMQGFGYPGMEGYSAYQTLTSPQKLFAVIYFVDLVASKSDGTTAWLIRSQLLSEYLRCSNSIANSLGMLEPWDLFD